MTRERIDALEADKRELKAEVGRLIRLAPENARLEEALDNAGANNLVATILISVGGFLVSYATFTDKMAPKLAAAAAGCLLAGIGLMAWQSLRRWRKRQDRDSRG